MLASIVSWTPLAADFTRFSRDRRSAFFGVGLGYLVPTLWLFPMGALLLLSRDLSDPAALPAAVAAGGLASVLALGALTVDESDEAFANVYSTAVSLQNLFPRVSQRLLIVLVAAVATTGALVIDLRDYQPFLFLLGSFFVPLFGVLLADWLLAGRHYSRDDVFAGPPCGRAGSSRGSPASRCTSGSSRSGPAGGPRSSPTRIPAGCTRAPRCRPSPPRSR